VKFKSNFHQVYPNNKIYYLSISSFFRKTPGARGVADCHLCPPGRFCFPMNSTTPGVQCSVGYFCPLGSQLQYLCLPGYFCPHAKYQIPCPAGSYCPKGSIRPRRCPMGHYCKMDICKGNVIGEFINFLSLRCFPFY
jgi:hypothetical protein